MLAYGRGLSMLSLLMLWLGGFLKSHLDLSIMANFTHVSHLLLIAEVFEKVVFTQLQTFLENNSIFEEFQSGFRS